MLMSMSAMKDKTYNAPVWHIEQEPNGHKIINLYNIPVCLQLSSIDRIDNPATAHGYGEAFVEMTTRWRPSPDAHGRPRTCCQPLLSTF